MVLLRTYSVIRCCFFFMSGQEDDFLSGLGMSSCSSVEAQNHGLRTNETKENVCFSRVCYQSPLQRWSWKMQCHFIFVHAHVRACVCVFVWVRERVNKWLSRWADGQVSPGYLSSEWTHWQCRRGFVQGAELEAVNAEGSCSRHSSRFFLTSKTAGREVNTEHLTGKLCLCVFLSQGLFYQHMEMMILNYFQKRKQFGCLVNYWLEHMQYAVRPLPHVKTEFFHDDVDSEQIPSHTL